MLKEKGETGIYGLPKEVIDKIREEGGLCHKAFFNFAYQTVSALNPSQTGMAIQSGAAPCCGPAGLCPLWDKEGNCCLERSKLLAELALINKKMEQIEDGEAADG
jgi:hypothetical protein